MTPSAPPFDPTVARTIHRISTVIATNVETAKFLRADGKPPSEFLRLGRLEKFYLAAEAQLPRVLVCRDLDTGTLSFRRGDETSATVRRARLWVLDAQAGPVVVVLSVDIECEPKTLIPFLEDCHYDHVTVGSVPLCRWGAAHLEVRRIGRTAVQAARASGWLRGVSVGQ